MRRFLHTYPEAPSLAGRNVVQAAPLVDPRVPQIPKFSVLGQGSLLQVQLPPSVELTAKRNALAGILGNGLASESFASRLRLARHPFASLFARQPLLNQKIVSSSPLTCLVGSTKNEFLSALELDGSVDWVVRSPIHARTGQQLRLSPRTGWRPGSAPFGHTIVTGRGLICIGSPASVVQIDVPEGDSVLVAKAHLSAYTVDTNASNRTPVLADVKLQFEPLDDPTAQTEVVIEREPTTALSRFLSNPYIAPLLNAVKVSVTFISTLTRQIGNFLQSGNTSQFVEIQGPSTVLVSSSAVRRRQEVPKSTPLAPLAVKADTPATTEKTVV